MLKMSYLAVIGVAVALYHSMGVRGEEIGIGIGDAITTNFDYEVDDANEDFKIPGRFLAVAAAGGLCLAETNAERRANGKGPLTYDSRLERAAVEHSNYMKRINQICHDCPGETPWGQRIRNAGYQAKSMGENVAVGYSDCPSVVRGWMGSSGHRKNILADNLHLGCGRADKYWTCEYARN